MEVFNLFAALIRQEGLSRLERIQQRQGLAPDMRIAVAAGREEGGGPGAGALGGAQSSRVLHKLKVISCSTTRYKPTCAERAVHRRASQLQKEYVQKARAADRRYNEVPEGEVGPVEQKLLQLGEIRGVVAENWGEVSEPCHALLAHLATSRVRVAGPTRGRRGILRSEEAERAMAMSTLRRRLGVATVRAQSLSLLGRLEGLGPGTAAAGGRRQHAAEQKRRWRRMRHSAWLIGRDGAATVQDLPFYFK